ncbi:phasin family protein [Sphingomonas sp. CD22]|uniref:phasin family protein n=1 Tax=Sphingomonas sp. CD22 TaxID=3100214 RepID=UPI002ADF63F6|nr:phasin family protein [Sphingomonas sp. CD22]MEA1083590.1 phasin family protein [Sphingomonas sp. CD22]
MDDTVPKPPITPARRGAGAARGADAAAPPQRSKIKPTGRKPAAVRVPEPVAASLPVVPTAVAVAPIVPPAAKEVPMETIENVTATTQTAFTDATDRAKGAVDKSQKLLQEASEFGKGNIEALVESSKIAARGLETLGQDAAAYAKKSFEEATAVAKTLTSVKSPTEFFKLHSDYVRSSFDALVQHSSHNAEAVLKLAGEVVQPLSNRVALAAEKLKVAA